MASISEKTVRMEFDQDGFIKDPTVWSEELARRVAMEDGLGELSTEQWSVIRALRDHYMEYHTLPYMNHICKVNDLERNCMPALFHSAREAWRIAGLPNPGEEAKAYM